MNTQIIPAIGTTSSPCPSYPAQRTLLGCMNPIIAGVNQLGTSHSQVPAQAGLPSIQDGLNLVLNGINKNPGATSPAGNPGFRRGLELLRDNFSAALVPTTGAVDRLYGAIVTSVQPGGAASCLSVCQQTAGVVIEGNPVEPAAPDKSLRKQITEARDSINQLLAGLGSATDVPTGNPATTTITGGLNGVNGGLSSAITAIVQAGGLLDGVTGIRSGLVQLRGGLTNADANGGTSNPRCNPSVTPPGAGYCGFTEGLAQLVAGLNQAVAGLGQLDAGAEQASAGAGDLAAGIATAGDGAAQLSAGLKQVGQKVPAAVDGANQLADGSEKVAAGANQLATGLNDQLAPGAEELAAGLGSLQPAADGAQQLSDGLVQAKDGNQQIVDGSGELSKRGSKKLVEAGDATAREFAKEYAVMQALNVKGAESSTPFGAPTGSTDNRAAYDITIAPVGHAGGSNNAGRGLVALVVLGAGAFLATMVRARFA
jgi:putative membrane protein